MCGHLDTEYKHHMTMRTIKYQLLMQLKVLHMHLVSDVCPQGADLPPPSPPTITCTFAV